MKITDDMLGPWRTGTPPRVGVWEVDLADNDGRAFSYWSGTCWGVVSWQWYERLDNAISRAYESRHQTTERFIPRWRGLKENPNARR
jgi:hypothetical protein